MTLKQFVNRCKTQREAAVKLDIDQAQLNRYLHGAHSPAKAMRKYLEAFFGISF